MPIVLRIAAFVKSYTRLIVVPPAVAPAVVLNIAPSHTSSARLFGHLAPPGFGPPLNPSIEPPMSPAIIKSFRDPGATFRTI